MSGTLIFALVFAGAVAGYVGAFVVKARGQSGRKALLTHLAVGVLVGIVTGLLLTLFKL